MTIEYLNSATKRRWFPANTRPARPGVYLVKLGIRRWWRFWDGKHWLFGVSEMVPSPDPRSASRKSIPWTQDVEWCGLVESNS